VASVLESAAMLERESFPLTSLLLELVVIFAIGLLLELVLAFIVAS
jgi:hypothetical protein